MDIQTQTAPAAVTPPAAPVENTGTISSDFDTFLQLLVAQLENQDPLSPVDSTQFTEQLATFSGVEQQTLTNDLLREMNAGLGASSLNQLAGWVGMEARVNAPARFDGAPITLAIEPEGAADFARLVVRDESGAVVSREAIPTDTDTALWAGVADTGEPLSPGASTFELESVNDGEVIGTTPVDHYAKVIEARTGADGVDVVITGGTILPAADVVAIRAPSAPL